MSRDIQLRYISPKAYGISPIEFRISLQSTVLGSDNLQKTLRIQIPACLAAELECTSKGVCIRLLSAHCSIDRL